MHAIHPDRSWPLHGVARTRQLEQLAQAQLRPQVLMQRAGLAVAQLALALAPHARTIWLACGPGNNGGDGMLAALHLKRWGKHAVVTWLGTPESAPADAAAAYQAAVQAGVEFAATPPEQPDLCVDALFGIGLSRGAAPRAPNPTLTYWLEHLQRNSAPVLAVDVPSGLDADTGCATTQTVRAHHTLSLLTLKPGLFTANGRDASGQVWFDDLGLHGDATASAHAHANADARLIAPPAPWPRPHASHKGSYGDVAVIGGAAGMTGAAVLAARAALHHGAGRVFVGLLDESTTALDPVQPELMFRAVPTLALADMAVVCGCGGGDAVRAPLPRVLSTAKAVIIDADAINSIANDTQLQSLLAARGARGVATVLTPHPLEAARLLGTSAAEVQQDRLAAAQALAERFACVVVLKGSGTIVAGPGHIPAINPTGNASLATAGTGDVLAGMVGAALAAGLAPFAAATQCVYTHGLAADHWPATRALVASALFAPPLP
ncbi:MAG: NAD(P)H-hydrate dehydratase [Rhodoferax sp.]|nr:NAD(P)H-hydrate dehydratase [Rhodoferax sp.]